MQQRGRHLRGQVITHYPLRSWSAPPSLPTPRANLAGTATAYMHILWQPERPNPPNRFGTPTGQNCWLCNGSAVHAALPGDLAGQAFVQADARFPAEMTKQLARVGAGVALIAGSGWLAANFGPPPGDDFQLV